MNFKFICILMVFVTVLLSGCDNEEEANNNVKETGIKLISYKFANSIYDILYDEEGYITQIGNSPVIFNQKNQLVVNGHIFYFYTETGKISKLAFNNEETEFTYNDNNEVTSIKYNNPSLNNSTGYIIYEISYDNKGRLAEIIEDNNSENSETRYIRNILIYDSNENLREIESFKSKDGITYNNYSKHSLKFDKKKNPSRLLLEKLGIISNLVFTSLPGAQDPFNLLDTYFLFYSNVNNITSYVQINSNTNDTVYQETYNYTYNEEGHPVSAQILTKYNNMQYVAIRKWTYGTQ